VATALTQQRVMSSATLSEINSVAYLVAVMIWFGYTLAAAPSKSKAREDLLLRTEGWDTALEEARVVQVGSVLDLMDQTVERLFNPAEDPNVKLSSPPTL
jgi:hypothetical protein